MPSWFVEVRSDSDPVWPASCACCGHTPDTSVNALALLPLKNLRVPLCDPCRNHIKMPAGRFLLAGLLSSVWMLLCLSIGGPGPVGAVLALGGIYAVLWWAIFRRKRNPGCTTRISPPVVTGMAHQGARIFLFTSEDYARKFAAANSSSAIWRKGDKKPS
jgi:hypothetical protein